MQARHTRRFLLFGIILVGQSFADGGPTSLAQKPFIRTNSLENSTAIHQYIIKYDGVNRANNHRGLDRHARSVRGVCGTTNNEVDEFEAIIRSIVTISCELAKHIITELMEAPVRPPVTNTKVRRISKAAPIPKLPTSPTDTSVKPADIPRSSVNAKDKKLERLLENVMPLDSDIDDESIFEFLKIFNRDCGFDAPAPALLQTPQFVSPVIGRNDVAIVGGLTRHHWHTLHYVSEYNLLFIYDSLAEPGTQLSFRSLPAEEQRFIEVRYPELKPRQRSRAVVFKPVQRQEDSHSCGVLAAAYAASICLGDDPATVRYSRDMARMRRHFMAIIRRKKIILFPSGVVNRQLGE